MLGLIRRNFRYLDAATFTTIYKVMVRSQLEYAQCVWQPHKQKDIEALEKVQKRATRLIPSIRHLPYPARLQFLRLPTLAYRRVRGDMIEVYKILHGHYPPAATPDLHLQTTSETQGHNFKLFKSRCLKNIRYHSFCTRVVNEWNALPYDIVNAGTINSFKNQLDTHWDSRKYLCTYPTSSGNTQFTFK